MSDTSALVERNILWPRLPLLNTNMSREQEKETILSDTSGGADPTTVWLETVIEDRLPMDKEEEDDELELGASATNTRSDFWIRKMLDGIEVVVVSPKNMDRLAPLRMV